jgi:hypothetical protein
MNKNDIFKPPEKLGVRLIAWGSSEANAPNA